MTLNVWGIICRAMTELLINLERNWVNFLNLSIDCQKFKIEQFGVCFYSFVRKLPYALSGIKSTLKLKDYIFPSAKFTPG